MRQNVVVVAVFDRREARMGRGHEREPYDEGHGEDCQGVRRASANERPASRVGRAGYYHQPSPRSATTTSQRGNPTTPV